MATRLLRWLIMAFVVLAFLGGTTLQAMPPSQAAPAEPMASVMPGCTDAASAQHGVPAPAKGITPDCVKLTKCVGVAFVPLQTRVGPTDVAYARPAYWGRSPLPPGVSPAPSPFPPRAA